MAANDASVLDRPNGEPLVEEGQSSNPVVLPGGTHRQPRAVSKYWPRLRRVRFWTSVMDVPVTVQLKFPQSFPIDSEMCLRFRSSTDSRTSSCVTEKGTHSANCSESRRSRSAVLGGRRSWDHAATSSSIFESRVCKPCRKPSSFHRCTVVDVLVLMQRRPGGASDEFIDKFKYMTILRRVFAVFLLHFSHSVHSDVECRLCGSPWAIVVGHRGLALPIHLSDLWTNTCCSPQPVSTTTATTTTTTTSTTTGSTRFVLLFL